MFIDHYTLIGRHKIFFFFILFCGCVYGQNVTIRGVAPAYKGKVIQLFTLTDYITFIRQKESADTIDGNGGFELHMHTEISQPVFLKINNVTATVYVQPDYVYALTIPEIDSAMSRNADVEVPVNIGLLSTDSTELNALIFDFQHQYNALFTNDDARYFGRASMFRRTDSLQKLTEKRYRMVKNDYFHRYVDYLIASLNASLSRGEKYLMKAYIADRPIKYNHYEYMQFFNAMFKGYLDRIAAQRKGESLYHIINSGGEYSTLLNFVRFEKELGNDSLRELIILKNLWDCYFNPEFDSGAVIALVSQINAQTKNNEHKMISSSMLAYFNKLQVGAAAPVFSAVARDNKTVSSSAFKGRWIYLNFFSTKNIESIKEMPKIAALKKKFGDKIVFVSVCLDENFADYQAYLRNNPRFDWPVWFNNNKKQGITAKEAYYLTGTEGYFLISNAGYLVQSPALSPSHGIEYKLNVIFKIKERATKTGIR